MSSGAGCYQQRADGHRHAGGHAHRWRQERLLSDPATAHPEDLHCHFATHLADAGPGAPAIFTGAP